MAVCPFALKKLIPPGSNDPRITPRVAILHVDAGNASSLYDYFRTRSGGIESHFFVRSDGVIEQYRDTAFQADANNLANDFAVSIETQGYGAGTWNDRQLAAIKRLLVWLHEVHGIPLRKVQHWNGSGVGYHTLFGAPSQWTPEAKTCPGPDRIKQFDSLLVPWMRQMTKGKKIRVVTYNVAHGRNQAQVHKELKRLSKKADVMLLQEAQGYRAILLDIPNFRLRGHGENVILVREGLTVRHTDVKRVTSKVWRTARGRKTQPEWATFATVEGIEFSSWHFPPSVQSKAQRLRMPARWRAYREMVTNFRVGKVAIAGMDSNVHAGTDDGSEPFFPKRFLRRRGLARVFPDAPTHHKRIIDGFAVRGVNVKGIRVLGGYGSDHRPVVLTATYLPKNA